MFLNYSNIFLKFHFDVLKMVKIITSFISSHVKGTICW